jgi:hypothetical protein
MWQSLHVPIGGAEARGLKFVLNLADIGPNGVVALDKYNTEENHRGYPVGICSQQDLADIYETRLPFLASAPITRKG